MPWRCPACDIEIRHNEADDRPRPGSVYRCHVCRLELTLDAEKDRLSVVPFDGASDPSDRRTSTR
jgi:hypothetical protein